jgi:hypothetical protein
VALEKYGKHKTLEANLGGLPRGGNS